MPSKSGSPIIIDGGGSASLDFDGADYKPKPGGDPDYHYATGWKMNSLKVIDSSGRKIDLSSLVSSKPDQCQVVVYHKDPVNSGGDDYITISGDPLGIRFSGQTFKKNQAGAPKPGSYYNSKRKISRVEVYPDGGFGKLTFDFPGTGKGSVEAGFISVSSRQTVPARKKK